MHTPPPHRRGPGSPLAAALLTLAAAVSQPTQAQVTSDTSQSGSGSGQNVVASTPLATATVGNAYEQYILSLRPAEGVVRWSLHGEPPAAARPEDDVFAPVAPVPVPLQPGEAEAPDRDTVSIAAAAFPGETFESALASAAARHPLTAKRRQQLDAYLARRHALAAALQARLVELADATPAARTSALAAYAVEQTPALLELRTAEEAIRTELTRPGLFQDYAAEGQIRFWHRPEAAAEPTLVPAPANDALNAAGLQAGFSPEQRLLLREMADEAIAGSRDSVAFWPATMRLAVGPDLPATLRGKLDDLAWRKDALKAELRAAIARRDGFLTIGERTKFYEELARVQAPRCAELDRLAEEIRAELAARGLAHPGHADLHRLAVLQPGLSSDQRRLLLNVALAQRQEPAPRGDTALAR